MPLPPSVRLWTMVLLHFAAIASIVYGFVDPRFAGIPLIVGIAFQVAQVLHCWDGVRAKPLRNYHIHVLGIHVTFLAMRWLVLAWYGFMLLDAVGFLAPFLAWKLGGLFTKVGELGERVLKGPIQYVEALALVNLFLLPRATGLLAMLGYTVWWITYRVSTDGESYRMWQGWGQMIRSIAGKLPTSLQGVLLAPLDGIGALYRRVAGLWS